MIISGQTAALAAATATQVAPSTAGHHLIVKVESGGPVYIGDKDVDATGGLSLAAGDVLTIPIASPDQVYAFETAGGGIVSWVVTTG